MRAGSSWSGSTWLHAASLESHCSSRQTSQYQHQALYKVQQGPLLADTAVSCSAVSACECVHPNVSQLYFCLPFISFCPDAALDEHTCQVSMLAVHRHKALQLEQTLQGRKTLSEQPQECPIQLQSECFSPAAQDNPFSDASCTDQLSGQAQQAFPQATDHTRVHDSLDRALQHVDPNPCAWHGEPPIQSPWSAEAESGQSGNGASVSAAGSAGGCSLRELAWEAAPQAAPAGQPATAVSALQACTPKAL